MKKISRRAALKAGLVGGIVVSLGTEGASDYLSRLIPTPRETEGPFYPIVAQKDKDFDLTRVEGRPGPAKGKVIIVEGNVLSNKGHSISGATVELWQANASGKYSHPRDPNPAPRDPNFQGWAIVPSGQNGRFRFKTIMPGAYPASYDWIRPPHIHFKISKRGYLELITQMYFPGHLLNEKDLLLRRKNKEQRKLMIAQEIDGKIKVFRYRIVLQIT